MKISDKSGQERAYLINYDNFAEDAKFITRGLHVRRIKKYDIRVAIQGEDELCSVKKTVRGVCKVLSETPELQYLNISLVDFMGTESDDFTEIGSNGSVEIESDDSTKIE